MKLSEIVSVAGVPGIHKVVGKNNNGLIVESLDANKKRFATNIRQRVSFLSDIAIYTDEGETKLWEVFTALKKKEDAGETVVTGKEDDAGLKQALAEVLPTYDKDKVYVSDMKKLFNWFHNVKGELDWENLGKEEQENEDGESTENKTKSENFIPKNVKGPAPKTNAGAKTKTTTPRKMGS